MRCAWGMALVLLGLLSACSTAALHETPASGVWTRPLFASDTESLLVYYEWAHRLSAPQLAREYDAAHQAFTRTASDFDRLRCAILLSVPGTTVVDLPRALELLEPVAKDTVAPLHSVAYLLQSQFSERQRLDASAADLRQKLDALKSLEKDMSQHPTHAQ